MNFRLFFNCGANLNDVQVTSSASKQPTDVVALNGIVMPQLKIGKKIPQNISSDLMTVYANSSSLDSETRNPSPSNNSEYSDPGVMCCPHAEPKFIPIDTSFDDVTVNQLTNDMNPRTTTPLVCMPALSKKLSVFYTSRELNPQFVRELNSGVRNFLNRKHDAIEKTRIKLEAKNDQDVFEDAYENGCTF